MPRLRLHGTRRGGFGAPLHDGAGAPWLCVNPVEGVDGCWGMYYSPCDGGRPIRVATLTEYECEGGEVRLAGPEGLAYAAVMFNPPGKGNRLATLYSCSTPPRRSIES